MKKLFKRVSLKYYVMLSLVLIILIQTSVFTGFLVASKIPESMDENTFATLERTVSSSAFALEQYLAGVMDISELSSLISDKIERNADESGADAYLSDSENRRRLFSDSAPYLLNSMKEACASSCFLILENGADSSLNDGVCLTDQNPGNAAKDDSDIYLAAGPVLLLYDCGLTLDSRWSERLDTQSDYPFYRTVLDSVSDFPKLSADELGYFYATQNTLFYAAPMLDDAGSAYGVIGFGMDFDYIKTLLPDAGLLIDSDGSYLLGSTQELSNDCTVQSVYIGNEASYPALANGESVRLTAHDLEYGIYNVLSGTSGDSASVCLAPLRLYTQQSPYYAQQWVLCGVVHAGMLYTPSEHLKLVLVASVLVSLLISVVGTLLITHVFMRPIRMLVRSIPKLSPGNYELPQTHIYEFDELACAIKKQNASIYRSGNKMADIIDDAGVSLAVCEFDESSETAYCTHKLFEILGIPDTGWSHNHISASALKARLKHLEAFLAQSHENPDIFRYQRAADESKWLDIKKKTADRNTLVIISDITQSVLEKENIIRDRDYDSLTGLLNRGAFAREMKYMLDEGHCSNGLLSIWDLDNLKYTNDTYGHEIGDRYICTLSDLLKRRMPEKSFSARLAGDEFTMFLYDEPKERLVAILKSIHDELMQETLLLPDGLELSMSASAGMSFYSEDGTNYADLLKYADFAMYQVKKASKGSIRAYDKEAYLRDYILVQGVGELDRLIRHEAIKYVYQPIFSLSNGTIFAYEALIRPISDLLRKPEELIRVAQAQAKLDKIEHITWFHALKGFFEQLREGDSARIFINSIPNQLLADEEWHMIEQMYGSRLSRVVMEITENEKSEAGIDAKKRAFCSRWNIPVALDDYGSGYSNSDMLVSFDFHFVKLDMTLIRDIHKNPSTQSLVRGMITYCHDNFIRVIAEGIETVEEYNTAKELGADFGQGFYLAKPSLELYP